MDNNQNKKNNKNNPNNNRQGLGIVLITTLLVAFVLIGFFSAMGNTSQREISYDKFLKLVSEHKVKEVKLDSEKIYITLTDKAREEAREKAVEKAEKEGRLSPFEEAMERLRIQLPSVKKEGKEHAPDFYTGYVDDDTLVTKLDRAGVKFQSEIPDTIGQLFFEMFVTVILPLLLMVWLFTYMMKRMNKGGGMMGIGKSNAKMYMEKETGVTFRDVAGEDEAKESLQEVVDFLHNPGKYSGIGAKLPKGALLVGPPGTGKTLLAKAVAGEAKVPFFSLSGSAFVEMYVGVGASRVRDLFKQAQQSAPCIVFIDEIDAIGKTRDTAMGGNDEREQTLNQMLVEMDGFGVNEGIIVMAATNRVDILDPAILRPGRFDRKVVVGRPDVRGRLEILNVHAAKKPLGDDVDLDSLARTTAGFTGADLENILNEAAINAAKSKRKFITNADVNYAFVKVGIGVEKRSKIISEKEKKITAYHESGHAILFHVLPDVGPVHTISIIPTGMGAAGYTMPLPEKDEMFNTKGKMLQNIIVSLGGRVAEELIFDDITTGASQDIKQATATARDMVTKYGFSDRLGLINYASSDEDEVFIGRDLAHTRPYGEDIATAIDEEVKNIIDDCYAQAKKIISEHMDVLEKSSELLLEKEKVTREEFEALFDNGSGTDDDGIMGTTIV